MTAQLASHLTEVSREALEMGLEMGRAHVHEHGEIVYRAPQLMCGCWNKMSGYWNNQVPIAVAVVTDGPLRIEELYEYPTGQLARYEHPRAPEIVDAVARNPAGKVLKTELRLRYGAQGCSVKHSATKGSAT